MTMTEKEIEDLHKEYIEVPSILKGSFGEYVVLRSKYSKEEIENILVNARKMKEMLKDTNIKTKPRSYSRKWALVGIFG